MNSQFGENREKDFREENSCKLKLWLSTDFDDRVSNYWRIPIGENFSGLKQDEGLECQTDLKNTMPAHLGSFVLNNSRRIMNNFAPEKNGFKFNKGYHTDTDGIFNGRKHWDVLGTVGLIGGIQCHVESDLKIEGFFL